MKLKNPLAIHSINLTVVSIIMAVWAWELIAFLQYQNRVIGLVTPMYYIAKTLAIGYIPFAIIVSLLVVQLLISRRKTP